MPETKEADRRLADEVGRKVARRLRARRRERLPWLGAYGVVGWSIVLPTLAGIACGVWIDTRWPSRVSWTLMLIAAGLAVGCWNAWRWVTLEQRAIQDHRADSSEGESDD